MAAYISVCYLIQQQVLHIFKCIAGQAVSFNTLEDMRTWADRLTKITLSVYERVLKKKKKKSQWSHKASKNFLIIDSYEVQEQNLKRIKFAKCSRLDTIRDRRFYCPVCCDLSHVDRLVEMPFELCSKI